MPPAPSYPSGEFLRRSLDPDDPMAESQRQRIEAHVAECDRGCKQVIDALLRGHLLKVPTEPAASAVAVTHPLPTVPGYDVG